MRSLEPFDAHRELIVNCLRGHSQSQYKLYSLYSKAMYNICLRMMQNEHDAEDVLQTAFVDIFTKLDTFKYESTLGAWIKRIVINKCINQLKKNKIHFEEISDHMQNGLLQQIEEPVQSCTVSGVKEAIAELPEGYRVVFSLYAMEGYDHEEIGNILGVSVSTSKSQYSRAKKKIKQILNERQIEKTNI